MRVKLLILLSAIAFSKIANTQTYVIDNNFKNDYIVSSALWFEDITKTKTVNQISVLPIDSFINCNEKIFYKGYSNKCYWIKINIKNISSSYKNLIFIYDYPLIYKVHFYKPENLSYVKEIGGDAYKFKTWENELRQPGFYANIEPHSEKTFYFRIESDGDVIIAPIKLYTTSSYFSYTLYQQFFLGFFYGVIVLLIIVNIFYFINLKNKSYLFYVLYVFFMGLFMSTRDGIAYKYFYPNLPFISKYLVLLTATTSIVIITMFSQNILKIKENYPIKNKLLSIVSIIIILAFCLSFISDKALSISLETTNNLTILIILLILISAIQLIIKRKEIIAIYFLIAFAFLILGSTNIILMNLGVFLPFSADNVMKVGIVLELITFAIGLIFYFKRMLTDITKKALDSLQQLTKIKDETNIKLEKEVNIRTKELQEKNYNLEQLNREITIQNEEITAQRDFVMRQGDKISKQNEKIKDQNVILTNQQKEITDSIRYAKIIQSALMTGNETQKCSYPQHFVLSMPRNIVSGDFFWIRYNSNYFVAIAADSTGHGVPGAFMSTLGTSLLNEIINIDSELQTPDVILNKMKNKLVTILHQNINSEFKDGIDMALCIYNYKTNILNYAGANRPLLIIENDEIEIIKPDHIPIGYHPNADKNFTAHTIKIKKETSVYIYSDGICDQMGGEFGKKFNGKNFRNLLFENHKLDVETQKTNIEKSILNWKGKKEQTDDILLIGIKF